jgi:hypothetical protein
MKFPGWRFTTYASIVLLLATMAIFSRANGDDLLADHLSLRKLVRTFSCGQAS